MNFKMKRTELAHYLHEQLNVSKIKDYCPNGLQIEGREQIQRVLCAVSASQAAIDKAIKINADAILVHHGYFWRSEEACITGIRKKRIAALLKNDINLLAYHLPLDLHEVWGNNAQLARLFGWRVTERAGQNEIVFIGEPEQPETAAYIARRLGKVLGREPLLVGEGSRLVKRIAWCSGGAQGYFEEAINAGVDLYISGEISEPTTHLARESGVPYIAAGHHATERYGIQALGQHLATQFGLDVVFADLDNPV